MAAFEVWPEAQPPILIDHKGGVRLENIQMFYVHIGDGIIINDSTDIVLKNVHVDVDQNNLTGIPVRIKGGFGFYFDGGGYASSPFGISPSIEFTEPVACNASGIVRFRGIYLAYHGIRAQFACGAAGPYTFDDVLYELAMDPFLTIDTGGNLLEGAVLRDIVMADELGTPGHGLPPLISASGSRIHGVQIANCNIDSTQLTSGDPLMGLEVWSNRDGVVVGQPFGYILHMPSGVIDTTAKLAVPHAVVGVPVRPPDCRRHFPIHPRESWKSPQAAYLPVCRN
jgi:hypothetical protein